MKKWIILLLGLTTLYAQAQMGIKAGLNFNAEKGLLESSRNIYKTKGENSIGFHVGFFKQFNFPVFYIKPEVLYVNYKESFIAPITQKQFDIKYNRIDVPLSVGTKLLMNKLKLQAGPIFSYYFKDNIKWDDVSNIKQEDISIGLHVGAGVELSKLSFDIRYDFPLNKRQTTFVKENLGEFKTINTPQMLMLSLGYAF